MPADAKEDLRIKLDALAKKARLHHPGDSAFEKPRRKRVNNSVRALWEQLFSDKPRRDWLLPMKYACTDTALRLRAHQARLFEEE